MCGFAGFIDDLTVRQKEPIIHEMADSIKHRGPDGEGFYTDPYVAMGF